MANTYIRTTSHPRPLWLVVSDDQRQPPDTQGPINQHTQKSARSNSQISLDLMATNKIEWRSREEMREHRREKKTSKIEYGEG